MELTTITAGPVASRALRTADVAARRKVSITMTYGEADIEAAAAAVGVDLSVCERSSMLLLLDDTIVDVVRAGIRSALGDRIREEMSSLAAGHAHSEDE